MGKIKAYIKLILKVFGEFSRDLPLIHGAAIAYYAILALVPLMYMGFMIFGSILGDETVKLILEELIQNQIGISDVESIMAMLDGVSFEDGSLALQIAGSVMVAFSCTAIMNTMRKSINKFYGLERPDLHARKVLVGNLIFRGLSLVAIIAVTLFVIMVYFAETFLLSVSDRFFEDVRFMHWIFGEVAQHGLPIFSNVLVLTFIFKFLHDGVIEWKIAIRGALTTGLLLYIGQLLLKVYLTTYFFASGVGVAGSILMLLVWVYYSSLIILLGVKFTGAYAKYKDVPVTYRD